jgi:2-methylcitrate dehydratase PrpD
MDKTPPPVTRWLAEHASSMTYGDLPDAAVIVARQCILDWFAVTIPGAAEPAVRILSEELLADGALPAASLVGAGARSSALNAALINGTASHALDYDDVNMAILGHPTVAVLPGLLALAEQIDATPQDVITAFVAGYDVVCRTGALMSPGHYQHGFHATATIGSVGAAAACLALMQTPLQLLTESLRPWRQA